MLKKINIFLSFILTLNLVICNANAVETIKQEDEYLLDVSLPETVQKEVKPITTPTIVNQAPSKIFPTKKERSQTRAEEKEWFSIRTKEEVIQEPAKEDPLIAELKTAINNCYKNNEEKLEIEKSLLREGNLYNNTAYITETFETINLCYENLGSDIISLYYVDDPKVIKEFENKTKTFYIKATDTSFNVNKCGDNCSLEALIDNQVNKFKEFEIYLYKLIDNRP
jgi:hypothetical protein